MAGETLKKSNASRRTGAKQIQSDRGPVRQRPKMDNLNRREQNEHLANGSSVPGELARPDQMLHHQIRRNQTTHDLNGLRQRQVFKSSSRS